MPFAVLPDTADVAALPLLVAPSAYARGMNYAQTGRVMRVYWDDETHELRGLVRGRGSVYQTAAWFQPEGGVLAFTGGECTCPMEVDCKHVVALVVAASDSMEPSEDRKKPTTWADVLDDVLQSSDHSSSSAGDDLPLALQLSIASDPGGRPVLRARPARPGKTGWVNGNLAWNQLGHEYYSGGLVSSHVAILQEVYALYRSGGQSRGSYYMGNEKEINLSAFDSPNLWPLLDEALARGVRLVHAIKSLGDVGPYREAALHLDLTGESEDGLTLRPVVHLADPGGLADEAAQRVTPMAFIGGPAHGVAYTTADKAGDVTRRRIHLARLAKPVPRQLTDLALSDQALTIPADQTHRFMEGYYLRLRRIARVTSSDGSVTPPEVSGPTLSMHAAYGDDHELTLDLEWVYRIDDREVRSQLHSPAGEAPHRDEELEQKLLADVRLPLESLGFRTDSGDLADHADLSGLDTMRFTTEALPLLEEHPDVDVELTGDPADYREASDSVSIGIAADETDDPDWFDLSVSVSVDGQDVPLADVITALVGDRSYLLLPDGAYFSLDKPELHRLRDILTEARALRDDSHEDRLTISRYQAGLWDELVSLGVVDRQADAWQQQVEGLLSLTSVEPVKPPPGLQATLRPYQHDGFHWLAFLWQHRLGGILADDMGLGKTVQTLAMICHAKDHDPAMPPVIIVAPTSVVPNWAAEAVRFAPQLRVAVVTETERRRRRSLSAAVAGADVVVTSYTLFRLEYDAYAELTWSGMVLDEAQQVKNYQSKAYQAVRRLPAPFKLAITGTPMENNLMELWSMLSITAPGLFPNPARFQEYYARPIEKGHDTERLAQLRQRIKPLMKRRTKEQVATDLPDKQEQVLEVELHPKHRAAYEQRLQRERQKILGLVDDIDKNRFTILQSLTLLRQLSLHAGLVDDEYGDIPSAKIDALVEHLDDIVGSGHRALVFSQFTGFLGAVRERLQAAEIVHTYLDGTTRDRGKVLDEFKSGDAPVFLISLKAGGFGLNLTEADYVFLLDPWWNPATESQAVDRTHRIGQTRNVMVYRLIAKDTIEQKVMALKQRKSELFDSVMDDGAAFGSALTADDIRNLFT